MTAVDVVGENIEPRIHRFCGSVVESQVTSVSFVVMKTLTVGSGHMHHCLVGSQDSETLKNTSLSRGGFTLWSIFGSVPPDALKASLLRRKTIKGTCICSSSDIPHCIPCLGDVLHNFYSDKIISHTCCCWPLLALERNVLFAPCSLGPLLSIWKRVTFTIVNFHCYMGTKHKKNYDSLVSTFYLVLGIHQVG